MLVELHIDLDLDWLIGCGARAFGTLLAGWTEDQNATAGFNQQKLRDFIYDRLSGSLREQGYSAQEIDAVVSLKPQRLGDVPKRLAAVRTFAALAEAPALAAANKRIGNILKKVPEVDPHVSEVLLQEPAELSLYAAMQNVAPKAKAQFEAGDYTASLQTLAALRAPVDAFFENVMVNAEAIDLRLNRQGLLLKLHQAMNQVADLSKLAA
jgi:glycyl-tRNA synthetase beta chain